MKTLANASDKQEIVRRLTAIGPGSQRRWGKMTVVEMICHVSDALRVALAEKDAKPVSNGLPRSVFKWIALSTPTRWPHGVRTVPECDPRAGGTPPAEIEKDLGELRELLDRFTRQAQGFKWPPHPMFGPMTEGDWMRWGYLHVDHHLRQFGA